MLCFECPLDSFVEYVVEIAHIADVNSPRFIFIELLKDGDLELCGI